MNDMAMTTAHGWPVCTALIAGLMLSAGCAPPASKSGDAGTDAGSEPSYTLTVTPASTSVTSIDGTQGQVTFTATATSTTGETTDVTTAAEWSVEKPLLGTFAGARFTSSGIPGSTVVKCHWKGLTQTAQLTVNVEKSLVTGSAPINARALFKAAAEDSQLAPNVVYPMDGTIFPPNLGDLEAHWVDTAGADLFEMTLSSAQFKVSLYTKEAPQAQSWLPLSAAGANQWSVVSEGARGKAFQLSIRALKLSDPSKAGTKTLSLAFSQDDLLGGIYYWSPSGPAGLYRHDFGKANSPPEKYYNNTHFPAMVPTAGTSCVGCHTVSPNGDRVAFDYQVDGDPHWGAVVATDTRQNVFPPSTALKWIFPTFEPSGNRLVTCSAFNSGVLTLREANTGASLGTIQTPGFSTHPDFSPLGNAIAYTLASTHIDEAQVSNGSIVVQPFDATAGTFGSARVLVQNIGAQNNYYPSWSPDGSWILFNRSQAGSYFQPTAELYAVPADGSLPPIALTAANITVGLTNSWPRFAPFIEKTADGRSLVWLTFSSTRPFGVRPKTGAQLWMAAFDLSKAAKGQDPSSPAFHLPFQDSTTSNHSAQWTRTIVEIN